MFSKNQTDSTFAECRIYFYNPSLKEVCHLELYLPNTHTMLTFVKQSYAMADKASTDHLKEDLASDVDDVPEDGDRIGNESDVSKAKQDEPRTPALSYSERQAKEKVEAREREVATERQASMRTYLSSPFLDNGIRFLISWSPDHGSSH